MVPTIDFLHGPDTTPSDTKAVFATATVHPIEDLGITAGLRYTKDKKDYTYFRSNPDGSLPNPGRASPVPQARSMMNRTACSPASTTSPARSRATVPTGALVGDYRFTPQLLAYVSASTGFKGGGSTHVRSLPTSACLSSLKR